MTLYDVFFAFLRNLNRQNAPSYLQEIAEDVEFEEITTNLIEYEQDKEILG